MNPAVSKFVLHIALLLGLASGLRAAAPVAPEVTGLELRANGSFVFDGVNVFAGHFDRDWHRADQLRARPSPGYPRRSGAVWETRMTITPREAAPITLAQRLERLDEFSFRVSHEVTHPGLPSREMFIQLEIPLEIAAGKTIELDGVVHSLPVEFGALRLFGDNATRPRRLVFPGATGTLTVEGEFSLLAQDQRQWKQDNYAIRLRFSPGGDTLTRATLETTFRAAPHRSTPLSLRNAANFGFRDPVAGDGRGGWTDQGADNDLASLPSGSLNAAGVTFDILDAQTNSGRSAIVLGKTGQNFLPRSADLPLPADGEAREWRYLYLLHASGWTPPVGVTVGHVVLRHADRSETRHDIVSGRDVGNWWAPLQLENGAVGWSGDNPRSRVGLYVSRIALGDKPVTGVRFESAGPAMWMIAGVSASAGDIRPFTPVRPWTSAAGGEWAVHEHEIDIEAGSVFDFSGQLDAPAGRHGPVFVTPEGRFAFRDQPDRRARFWGVNLCFSANFPDKQTADRLAERLVRAGYNSVRFHHYDRQIQLKGGSSWEIDPAMLDRFDYLFAAMKRHGLYINLDLYTSRAFSPAEFAALGFDPSTDTSAASGEMHWRFKALMPVSEKAFDTWSRFARALLTHRNPYTGLTWGEDPALVGICPVNEDSPGGRIDSDPVVSRAYQDAFEKWLAEPNNTAATGDRTHAYNRFIIEAHIRHDSRLRDFIHTLGVTVPLTGTNHQSSQGLAFARAHYDYVDNHQYWDHPVFPQQRFQLPFQFRQNSSTQAAAQTPRGVMPTRIFGKPFALTEFNFVRPNQYRAESAVLMPAYAGLQDWDALYNFDYASSSKTLARAEVGGTFSIAGDPIGQIADRVGAAIFLRGDIAPARGRLDFAVQATTAFSSRGRMFPDAFSRLGLVTRIGSRPAATEALAREQGVSAAVVEPDTAGAGTGAAQRVYPADDTLAPRLQRDGVLPADSVSADGKRYRSETGQIELLTDPGTVKVTTARSELFVLAPGASLVGQRVAVTNGTVFGTVAVVSVDGLPIAESRRLLVTHLTDALPSDMRFADTERRLLEARGKMPHLLRRGSAELTLRIDGDNYRAWAVSPSGSRLREVPFVKTGHGWKLKAETVTATGTQLAYEIARE